MAYLSENIRILRCARGMRQVQLAKALGVSKQCVSNWENDNVVPSIEMLEKIADLFSASTDYLLGRNSCATLDISALTTEQASHISMIVEDFIKLNNMQ